MDKVRIKVEWVFNNVSILLLLLLTLLLLLLLLYGRREGGFFGLQEEASNLSFLS